MWNKIYLEGHRPSVPENMIFFADAISNVVATFDDYHFHDQWKQNCAGIESGVLNIANHTPPSLEQSMLKVGAFDSPRPEENRYIPEKLQEWDTVQRSIDDAAHDIGMAAYDGSLVKGFYRAKTGGKMAEIPSKFWGVDRDIFWERAHQCAFSSIDPFNLSV